MHTDDFTKFHDGIAGVMAFYEKTVSGFALDVWWNALKRYELAAVVDAFNRHLNNPDTGKFAPKPADIVQMLQGSTQDSALRAWAKVDRAVREKGTYVDVVFDDPIIHRVLTEMGGWIKLGTETGDKWPFVAREFENRYRGYMVRSETPEYPPILIGMITAENRKKGYKAVPPVLVGDAHKATRVMNGGTDTPVLQFRQLGESDMPAPAVELRKVG